MEIKVLRNIMEVNDVIAEKNRQSLDEKGILTLNLMSSPGAGKTTLLERTIEGLKHELTMAVIEGDIATQYDAERIQRHGARVLQINTQGACHLDANMVRNAMENLDLNGVQLLFIENVGNLVCPAEFALGEDLKVAVLSVTEGDDKPEKYPVMFQESRALVINKTDLLPFVDFNIEAAKQRALTINPRLRVFEVSCRSGEGLDSWFDWLRQLVAKKQGKQ
jgi:hydrogenase nickel incorporation protein HypB